MLNENFGKQELGKLCDLCFRASTGNSAETALLMELTVVSETSIWSRTSSFNDDQLSMIGQMRFCSGTIVLVC